MAADPIIHLEPFLDACKASLVAGLPAAIATINANHPDPDIQLDPVAAGNIWIGGYDVLAYPTIEIASPDWTMAQLSIGQHSADLGCIVIVRCHVRDVSPERIYRQALRYASAMLLVLLTDEAFGHRAVVEDVRGSYRFNPETEERQEASGHATINFRLQSGESW
jgi:hypothetical protein